MIKFEAKIKLPNASPIWVYVWAPDNQTARAMLIAQYGAAALFYGPTTATR